jgi:hypothetical protein
MFIPFQEIFQADNTLNDTHLEIFIKNQINL